MKHLPRCRYLPTDDFLLDLLEPLLFRRLRSHNLEISRLRLRLGLLGNEYVLLVRNLLPFSDCYVLLWINLGVGLDEGYQLLPLSLLLLAQHHTYGLGVEFGSGDSVYVAGLVLLLVEAHLPHFDLLVRVLHSRVIIAFIIFLCCSQSPGFGVLGFGLLDKQFLGVRELNRGSIGAVGLLGYQVVDLGHNTSLELALLLSDLGQFLLVYFWLARWLVDNNWRF